MARDHRDGVNCLGPNWRKIAITLINLQESETKGKLVLSLIASVDINVRVARDPGVSETRFTEADFNQELRSPAVAGSNGDTDGTTPTRQHQLREQNNSSQWSAFSYQLREKIDLYLSQ
jgi:hypothetical protein